MTYAPSLRARSRGSAAARVLDVAKQLRGAPVNQERPDAVRTGIDATALAELFTATCEDIRAATAGVDHAASLVVPAPGVNGLNWLLGHVVVARTNFLALLDVPSIWDWATAKRYVPGSPAITADAEDIVAFDRPRRDLGRTQDQLLAALDVTPLAALGEVRHGKPVGAQLATSLVHETTHAGEIAVVRRLVLG